MKVSTRALVGHPFHAKSNETLQRIRSDALLRLDALRRSDPEEAADEEFRRMAQVLDVGTILAARIHYREAA